MVNPITEALASHNYNDSISYNIHLHSIMNIPMLEQLKQDLQLKSSSQVFEPQIVRSNKHFNIVLKDGIEVWSIKDNLTPSLDLIIKRNRFKNNNANYQGHRFKGRKQ